MAYAGLDIGTSGCKLLIYEPDGKVLYRAFGKYSECGSGGHRELSPSRVWMEIKILLRSAADNFFGNIDALSIACIGESVVCLDDHDRVLCNSMLTGDSRGKRELEEIIHSVGELDILKITGLSPNELYGLPKYMWINRNTDIIRKSESILFYEDFVAYMLTGEKRVSFTTAARSMAFDIRRKEWSEELLDFAGIRRKQMSAPISPCTIVGQILPSMAEELHINPNMVIVSGGHDQSCAALGGGLSRADIAECSMGTCEFMFSMLPKAIYNDFMIQNSLTCIPHIIGDRYLTSVEVTTCGILKNWARDGILRETRNQCKEKGINFYDYMDGQIADMRTEVMVLPQFGSSGNPDLSMNRRGSISGLNIYTEPEEIYRAILEGIAFQMYMGYEKTLNLGVNISSIACTGGGAESDLTLQMRADIFGIKTVSSANNEAGTLACMLMAATAMGEYISLKEAIKHVVRIKKEYFPDIEMHDYYMEKYEKYKAFYNRIYDFIGS